MALTAARSELNISLVGEDETVRMLEDSKRRLGELETRLKGVAAAGKQQAAVALTQQNALGSANRALTGFAKGAENVVEGLDKTKGAFEKVVGALGFWGAAVSGGIALGAALWEALGGITSQVDAQTVAFNNLIASAQGYSASLRDIETAANAARVAANATTTDVARLNLALAQRGGDTAAIKFAEDALALEEAADKRLEATKQFTAADRELAAAEAERDRIIATREKLETEIQKRNDIIDDRRKRRLDDTSDVLKAERQLLSTELEDIQAAEAAAQRRVESMTDRVVGLENLLDRLGLIELDVEEKGAKVPEKPKGGRGPVREDPTESVLRARARRQAEEDRQREIRMNREFRQQLEENSRLREERLEREAKAAEAAQKWYAELKAEQERLSKFYASKPVFDFAEALTGNLVPGLEEVEATMSRIVAVFEKFREGQLGVAEAVGKGAMEIAAFTAKAIGGVKAEAAVRAVYETAMGFANLANPAVAAGHFTAAALLAGVAGGVIGGNKSAGPKAPSAPTKRDEPRNETGGERNVVYNIQAGVMDGQSVSRAIRQSERASRGTGHERRAGV